MWYAGSRLTCTLEYTTQLLQCRAIFRLWDLPAFGKYVSVRRLEDKKKQGAFAPKGKLGRLLVVRPITDRFCNILVKNGVVKETTPKPVSDKLAEAMTREKRQQVLGKVLGDLNKKMRRTPRFVHVMPKEPLPDVEPVAATTAVISIPAYTVVKFTTSKPAKARSKKIVDNVLGRLLSRDSSRTALHTENIGFPLSIALGLTVGRGHSTAHQTGRFLDLLPMIHKMAATRPSKKRKPCLSL
eukprot:3353216-Amphidinium_carterae.1